MTLTARCRKSIGRKPASKNMKGNRFGKHKKILSCHQETFFKPHRKLKLISRWRGLKKRKKFKKRQKRREREAGNYIKCHKLMRWGISGCGAEISNVFICFFDCLTTTKNFFQCFVWNFIVDFLLLDEDEEKIMQIWN